MGSRDGLFSVQVVAFGDAAPDAATGETSTADIDVIGFRLIRLAFVDHKCGRSKRPRPETRFTWIEVSGYYAAAIFGAYPTVALLVGPRRRHRRRKRGLCLHCGPDLRGTTGGVCSECGQGIATP